MAFSLTLSCEGAGHTTTTSGVAVACCIIGNVGRLATFTWEEEA